MILIIDDDIAIRTSLSLLLKQEGFEVSSAEGPEWAYAILKENSVELILLDMNFSLETSGEEGLEALKTIKELRQDIPVVLMTGWGSISLAVEGMKNGAVDFIHKPWDNANIIQVIRTALALSDKGKSSTENSLSRKQLNEKYGLENIIGEDARMLSILKTVGRISATEASVLITGESGTGKELIAEAIHQNSNRRNRPFIKVNLGGISSSLFESEMFGHKRGSFTDAKNDRVGRFAPSPDHGRDASRSMGGMA